MVKLTEGRQVSHRNLEMRIVKIQFN